MLEGKDYHGRSVLAIAAHAGNKDVFEQALKVLPDIFTGAQVRAIQSLWQYVLEWIHLNPSEFLVVSNIVRAS